MPTPETIDLAKLLAPIPGEAPTGADPRGSAASALYYQVKDARNAARAAERQISSGNLETQPPDWNPVIKLGTKLLAESAKDLEITAYMVEALLRIKGFAGLRDGFKLARGLVEAFWDGLYPTPDEEGIVTRIAPITGLNGEDAEGTLIAPINLVAMTDSATHGYLTFSNYRQALTTSKILDEKVKAKKIDEGAMSFEKFAAAVNETSVPFYRSLHDDLVEAIDENAKMSVAFDLKCNNQGPPNSTIRDSLNAVLDAIKDQARDKLAMSKPAEIQADPAEEAKGGKGDGKSAKEEDGRGEKLPLIRNREDALNAILQLADYFRKIEPHSMVPFALDQAVRWGRMPLTELLSELIPDDDSRSALFKQVGIRGGEVAEKSGKKK